MALSEIQAKAFEAGKRQASEVLAFRDEAIKARLYALKDPSDAFRLRAQSIDGKPLNSDLDKPEFFARVASKGVLLAEGDSWFDYPFYDVLRYLEDDHAYDVESVAHKGDPIEDMAYGKGQLEEFSRRLEKLLGRGTTPKAILLSGGGNDVAGNQFGMLLNHARSGMPHLNEQIVSGVIDDRIFSSYITILSAVTNICQQRLGKCIPIIVHGYDYAVADGRGYLGGFSILPGP